MDGDPPAAADEPDPAELMVPMIYVKCRRCRREIPAARRRAQAMGHLPKGSTPQTWACPHKGGVQWAEGHGPGSDGGGGVDWDRRPPV